MLPPVLKILESHAPNLDIEVRPIARAGALRFNELSLLANGEIDLLLAAVLTGDLAQPMPEIRGANLYQEEFVCVVRKGHPGVGETLDLQTYATLPHLLITITDDRSPTWIDRVLTERGLKRRIAMRTRYFMSAPLLVAESDLLLTCPRRLANYFCRLADFQIFEPPLPCPKYFEQIAWHSRFDSDPASLWLRSTIKDAVDEVFQQL